MEEPSGMVPTLIEGVPSGPVAPCAYWDLPQRGHVGRTRYVLMPDWPAEPALCVVQVIVTAIWTPKGLPTFSHVAAPFANRLRGPALQAPCIRQEAIVRTPWACDWGRAVLSVPPKGRLKIVVIAEVQVT